MRLCINAGREPWSAPRVADLCSQEPQLSAGPAGHEESHTTAMQLREFRRHNGQNRFTVDWNGEYVPDCKDHGMNRCGNTV
jgi:hypothetical protein